jgi:sulfite exporter TauE/SafE
LFPLTATALSIPALLLAGLAASPHCALLCGSISAHSLRGGDPMMPSYQRVLWTQAGRWSGYAALGGVAGLSGQSLLHHLPGPGVGRGLQLVAALSAIAIGALLVFDRRAAITNVTCHGPATHSRGRLPRTISDAHPFLRGALWALMPCGMLYSILLLAALSASPISGAALTGAFAIGSSPLLAAAGWSATRLPRGKTAARASGLWLVTVGAAGLFALSALPFQQLSIWCGIQH